jgi:predicted PurR-regulated permease PerM
MNQSNDIFTQKERNIIVLVIIVLLGLFLAYATRGIIGAVLSTIVMYTIFRPVNRWMVETLKWRRPIVATLIIVISFIIIVVPFLGLGKMLIDKAIELQQNPDWIKNIVQKTNEFAGDRFGKPDFLQEQLEKSMTYVGTLFTTFLAGTLGIFLDIAIMYFLLYFMLINYRSFERGLIRYSPFTAENAVIFGHEMRNITYSNVLGQLFIAIIQGAALSLGYIIFGFEDAFFWGVICAILAFIPLLGPPLIFVPAAIIAFTQGDNFGAIGLLIYGFVVVINIDNVLRLVIAKRLGDIHPIITIVGVIIGIPLFGVMGLVFGPLLLSYFLLTVRIYESKKREGADEITAADVVVQKTEKPG